MSASGWVHLDVAEVKRKTEKAMLVVLDDGEEVWLPLSQVSDADDYEEGGTDCSISITEWIADQKGLS